MKFKMRTMISVLLFFGAVHASACIYDIHQDGRSAFVYGNGWAMVCTKAETIGGMSTFKCDDLGEGKTLIIEKATKKGILDGQKCEKGSGLPDFCMMSGTC